ncbi:DUF4136 domain-containing protein [Methyloprofundus sp.]|uniref:DUF4136 domain-containing protein n=1 Tax=Methyloprofundus sp. TaxID=2020875 RepID=UPI003D0AF33F
MKKLTTIVLTICLILLSGCAVFNQKTCDIEVDAQTDPQANMAGYKSYAWLGSARVLNDPDNKWQPPAMDIAGDIKYLIDRELNKQGIYSNNENPDLAVAFFIGIDMDAQKIVDNPDTNVDVLEDVPQGALVVTLINVETGYVVWVGTAQADILEGTSPELVRERLDYAVSKMFKLLK